MNSVGQTICLSMIVKNEAAVIRRCLDSVRSLIDHWVIVDTGSTDGTQDIIRDYLKDVPGELVERPWQDFAHNRSEALTLARPYCDYTFVIDADDALELPAGFEMPALTADSYMVDIRDSNAVYQRQQFVRSALPWRYAGVLHEFLTCDGAGPHGHLPIIMRRNHDGARRNDPTTYQRDVEILERALAGETDAFLISRYTFYLAKSYRDSQQPEKALEHYLARGEMGYWHEEAYMALLHAARIKESLGHPEQEVIDTYLRAADKAPTRAEALHGASRFCRYRGRNEEGYQIAKRGIDLPPPTSELPVDPLVYNFNIHDEFSTNAYWSGHYNDGLNTCINLLCNMHVPITSRDRVSQNAKLFLARLPKEMALGPNGDGGLVEQHPLRASRNLVSRIEEPPKILIAILAKQKEKFLGLYLKCIFELDYPKSKISLYIRTNNNTDNTKIIISDWVQKVKDLYASIEFDDHDVDVAVQNFGVHEWNAIRFRVLGDIRNISLSKTKERDCDFYFVSDVDNFLASNTLRELVALNVPVVAPFLRSITPNIFYSNFHADVDINGYHKDCDQYQWILHRWIRGVIEVPLVHCTYLVRRDVIDSINYIDGSDRYEYVVFSDCLRKSNIPQYIDNRQIYGYITFAEDSPLHSEKEIDLAYKILQRRNFLTSLLGRQPTSLKTLIFCTSFSRDAETWRTRYRRWFDCILRSGLKFDQVVLIDDGSTVLPDWGDIQIHPADASKMVLDPAVILHFSNNLGRDIGHNYPGWYRSYAFAAEYAIHQGFEKVIHIESDSYVVSENLTHLINLVSDDWIAPWDDFFQMPESAIQVMAGSGLYDYYEFTRKPYSDLIHKVIERELPFRSINRVLKGEKFSEYLNYVPADIDYVVQATKNYPDDYFWWISGDNGQYSINPGEWTNYSLIAQALSSAAAKSGWLETFHKTEVYSDIPYNTICNGENHAIFHSIIIKIFGKYAKLIKAGKDDSEIAYFNFYESRFVPRNASHSNETIFVIEAAGDNRIALRSGKRYLGANPGGPVTLYSTECKAWETFVVHEING